MFHRKLSAAGLAAALAASAASFAAENPPPPAAPPAPPKAVHPPAAPAPPGARRLPQTAAGIPENIPPGARVTGPPARTRMGRDVTARIFELLDTDKDGKLSKAEAPDAVKAAFDELDINKDGFIGPDDVPAPRPIDPQRLGGQREHGGGLAQYDANHDGKIEASELPPKMAKVIQRLDKNGDGVLSGDELAPSAPPYPAAVAPVPGAPAAPAAKKDEPKKADSAPAAPPAAPAPKAAGK